MKRKKDLEDEEFIPESDGLMEKDIDIEDIEEKEDNAVKKLKEELKKCRKEKNEHLEALQKTKADFLNGKRRLEEQFEREKERTVNAFIQKLLPLCDSFDHAMHDKETWEGFDESWRNGIEAIHAQLNALLRAYNVKRVGEVGETFDPEKHEAVSTQESAEHAPEAVLTVLQSGYMRDTELIRPAKVIINN